MRSLVVCVASMLALCAVSPESLIGNATAQLYAPDIHPPHAASWVRGAPTPVEVITSDGLRLKGLRWSGRADLQPVVFLQGRSGDQLDAAHYAEPLALAGFPVLIASYRGYGGNPGSPDERGLKLDAEAFLKLASKIERRTALLVGHSLGAAIAIAVAADPDNASDGVVALGAFSSLRDAAPKLLRAFVGGGFSSVEAIRKLNAPIVLVRGRRDDVVTQEQSTRLLGQAPFGSLLLLLDKEDHRPDMTLVADLLPAILTARGGDLAPLVEQARRQTFAIFRKDPPPRP